MSRRGAAGTSLQHAGESLVMNPAWVAMQNQLKQSGDSAEECRDASQLAIGSSCCPRADALSPSEADSGFPPRLYFRGEHPITLRKALPKALSDS